MERKNEGKVRADVDRDRPRLSTSGVTPATVRTGTDHRWQTMMTPDSQALANDGESATCRKIDQISSLRQFRCCALAKPTMRDMGRVKRIGRYFVGKPRAWCWFRWLYSDADWRGDEATRRSVLAGVIMRGAHCLKVWTKKWQVVALSSAESELYAAVKTASEGVGIQSVAKDLGISCGLNLHLDA